MAAAMLATHFGSTTAALGIAQSIPAYVTPSVPELKVGFGIVAAAVLSTVGLGALATGGEASKQNEDFSGGGATGMASGAARHRVVVRSASGYDSHRCW